MIIHYIPMTADNTPEETAPVHEPVSSGKMLVRATEPRQFEPSISGAISL